MGWEQQIAQQDVKKRLTPPPFQKRYKIYSAPNWGPKMFNPPPTPCLPAPPFHPVIKEWSITSQILKDGKCC